MYYEIYPDTLFLENLFCNLICIGAMKISFDRAVTWKKCLLASVLASFADTAVTILLFQKLWILQLGILFPIEGFLICYCLELSEWKTRMLYIYEIGGLGLLMGGVLEYIEQWGKVTLEIFLTVVFALGIGAGITKRLEKTMKSQRILLRDVAVYKNQKCIEVKGFADTGNHLKDPVSQRPICILEYEELEKILTTRQKYEITELLDFGAPEGEIQTDYGFVPYESLGNPTGLLLVMEMDFMVICQEHGDRVIEKPMIGITRQKFAGLFHYSILLHKDFC